MGVGYVLVQNAGFDYRAYYADVAHSGMGMLRSRNRSNNRHYPCSLLDEVAYAHSACGDNNNVTRAGLPFSSANAAVICTRSPAESVTVATKVACLVVLLNDAVNDVTDDTPGQVSSIARKYACMTTKLTGRVDSHA